MADQEHLEILQRSISEQNAMNTWNAWRKIASEEKPDLRGAVLIVTALSNADFHNADLSGANLSGADLSSANFRGANLEGADLSAANLSSANLGSANFNNANLFAANLSKALLFSAKFKGANLTGADLSGVRVDTDTQFSNETYLADIDWDNARLIAIDWSNVHLLGDEKKAQQSRLKLTNEAKPKIIRLVEWQAANRAYRLLANALIAQGIDAARYQYRAQVCLRQVYRFQEKKRLAYIGLSILALVAGYGYRLPRLLFTYISSVFIFAAAYFIISQFIHLGNLTPLESLLISFTALHGRVFVGQFGFDSGLSWVAGIEAVFGVVIEGVFVAVLIQRLFGK